MGLLAVLATFDIAKQIVKGIQALATLLDFLGYLHLVLVHLFLDASAVKTDAPKSLEGCIEISLVIHRAGQFQMAKISRITLVVEVSESGVVHPSVHRLALDLCLVTSDSGRDLAPIDCNCLCD